MTEIYTRRPRRILTARTDAPQSSAQVGLAVPAIRAERKKDRRFASLTARLRAAERAAAYFHRVALALLGQVQDDPPLRDRCVTVAFLAGLDAIAKADPAVAAALNSSSMPELSPEACAALLLDLERGPSAVARLAVDKALAKRIGALSPVAQGIELGRITGAAVTSTPASIFSLYGERKS